MNSIDRSLTIAFFAMLISATTAIWNIFAFLMTQKAKRGSKASENKALEYANKANSHRATIAEFCRNQTNNSEGAKETRKILSFIGSNPMCRTRDVARHMNMEEKDMHEILRDLYVIDKSIISYKRLDESNISNNIWLLES